MTLIASLVTFTVVRSLSTVMVIYGRRKTALMILIGYLTGSLLDLALGGVFSFPSGEGSAASQTQFAYFQLNVIGYIIPGLIAIWFDRQGVLKTLAGLIVSSVLVRLTLVLIMPEVLMTYEAERALNRAELSTVLQGIFE